MCRRIFIGILIILVLVVAAAAGSYYYYNQLLEPVAPEASGEYTIVDIPPGANTEIIAATLYEEGLIQNELAFRVYVYRHDLAQGFIAGKYQLSPAMSAEQIVEKIQAGDVYAETLWFTIPEGYTVEETAGRLEEKGLAGKEQFLEIAATPPAEMKEEFPFLQEIEDPEVEYLLEGYLFPDTYEVYSDVGASDISKIMLRRMDQVINEEYRDRMSEMDLSLHEILTIASLIEREARVDHERSLISGVIYNRLEAGQLLQIDATIQYILGETKEFLTYDDLEVESPYNTYQNEGLPPGPIAAPGEAAIRAALYPEDTEYYFYNYKYDDTGEHYFSRTYEEHMENVRRAEENLD